VIWLAAFAALASGQNAPAPNRPTETLSDRMPKLRTGGTVLIQNARILTATRGTIERGSILVRNGKIVAVGDVAPVSGVTVIDATGKVVAPGFVDTHVHRGSETTNEGSDAIVAEGRMRDVLNSELKNVWQALASGETTGMLLHGSANPVGSESVVIKFKFGRNPDELPISDAPRQIKFALGENVTRAGLPTSVRFPRTRMGVEAVYRRAFAQAQDYRKAWADFRAGKKETAPKRDLRLDTLADILDRKVWVQCHGYRADELLMLARLGKEYGFKVGALQHAVEAYKIAPELAELGVGVSIFDAYASKLELYDGIAAHASAVLHPAGVLTSYHTDGTSGTTAINLNAAKAMRHGGLTEQQALQLVTINGARQLGIAHRTGSIEVGKDADLVIWNGHPLSVYSRVETTLIEGEVYFQARDAFGIGRNARYKAVLEPPVYLPNPPVPPAAPAYALVGGTVHPVSGPTLNGATVIVRGGRIAAIGRNIPVPADAHRIDARGLQIMPGLIDAWTAIGLTEFGQVGQATDARELGTFQPDLVAATAINVQSAHIRVARAQGITTVLTAPTGGPLAGQASVLKLDGGSREELTLRAKAGHVVAWPSTTGPRAFDIGAEEVFELHTDCEEQSHDHAMGGGAQGPPGAATASAQQLDEFIEAAAKYGRTPGLRNPIFDAVQPLFRGEGRVFVRARTAASIRDAVAYAKKRRWNIVLVGAADAWKEADLLKKEGISVILEAPARSLLTANVTVNDWDPYDTPYVTAGLLHRAGIPFAFMTDSFSEVMNLPHRAGSTIAYGLPWDAALKALTLDAATILGVADRVGSLQPGKDANLLVTQGDPFELNSAVRYVFIGGKPIPLQSKHTELRDQYLARVRK